MNTVKITGSDATLDLDVLSLVEVPKPSLPQVFSKFDDEEVYLARHESNALLLVCAEFVALSEALEKVGVDLTWYIADSEEVRANLHDNDPN